MSVYSGRSAKCPKCGGHSVGVQYDTERGMNYGKLKRTCATCRYSWHEEALDSDEAQKARDKQRSRP